MRQNPSTSHFSKRVREKIIKIRLIFRVFRQTLLYGDWHEFWVMCFFEDVINCRKSYRNRLRGNDSVRGRSFTIPIGLRCRR